MKKQKEHGQTGTYICAFLMGVILFWSFGKNWLKLESASVFLAGLIGVALAVVAFGLWSITHNTQNK